MTAGASDFDDSGLAAWFAHAVADAAIDVRRHTAWLARQAEESATFPGVLVDLAERGRPVVVATTDGRTWRGVPIAVGRDVVVLDDDGGRAVLVRLGAIGWVRPQPGDGAPRLGRVATGDVSLAELLADVAPNRPRAVLVAGGAEPVTGELRAASTEVVEVRLDGSGGTALVPSASVTSALLDGVAELA